MIAALRIVAVVNVAIWFGASVFFTFGVGPVFFSDRMLALLPRPYAGAVAMIVLERYFYLQLVCGGIAFLHLVGESLYLGRPVLRWTLSLVAGVLVLAMVGGVGIQPRLKSLHRTMYTATNPPEVRRLAERSFRVWHATAQIANLVMIAGVLVYLLRVTRVSDGSRYRG